MDLINRMKFLFTNSYSDYKREFYNGEDVDKISGNMSSEVALKYSAIYACVKVLSETVASLPIQVYRKTANGDKVEGKDIGLYDILHNAPNFDMTPFNFKESLMTSLCLNGNALATKIVNDKGELLALYPLNPESTIISRDTSTKNLTYEIKDGSNKKVMTRKFIFHIPGLSLNGINGLSPIAYAASAIELGMSYELFCRNFYKNGANTSMALVHPGTLKPDAYERLKKQVQEKQTGLKNVNRPWLLEDNMTIKELSIRPVDAQLLESKYFQIEDICRIYRVPQHLVQMLKESTNNNIEQQSLEFMIYTILPWLKRWEENINLQLLTQDERKAGYYVEFLTASLLRGDIKSRYEAYASGRLNSWLSVNDIRRFENLNPVEGGDTYIMPMNYIDITKIDERNEMTQANTKQEV